MWGRVIVLVPGGRSATVRRVNGETKIRMAGGVRHGWCWVRRLARHLAMASVMGAACPWVAGFAAEVPAPLVGAKRVVFLGDSITQAGHYVVDVESWLVARGVPVEVLNLGLASETASDLTEEENAGHKKSFGFARPALGERLARLLENAKPDVIVACYGMNDGSSLPADDSGLGRFSAAITRLRDDALKAGARHVVLCTPPVHDAKGNAAQRAHDENLTRYSEWLLGKRAAGWEVVDIHGPMSKVLAEGRAKDPKFGLAGDGVHPGRYGHWLMASAILTQWLGANLDGIASGEQFFAANGKEIRDLIRQRQSVRFAAWMTRIGHTRPGVAGAPGAAPGPPISEADAKAEEISQQIATLLTKPSGQPAPATSPGAGN